MIDVSSSNCNPTLIIDIPAVTFIISPPLTNYTPRPPPSEVAQGVTLNPQPSTLTPNPETLNPNPETLNTTLYTLHNLLCASGGDDKGAGVSGGGARGGPVQGDLDVRWVT